MTLSRLVDGSGRSYGRLDSRPRVVNPLDEFTGVRRWLRRWRLKEWQGFTLLHPELFSSLILQDAGYLASSEIYLRDAATGTRVHSSATARGGSLGIGERIWATGPRLLQDGYRVDYDFDAAGGQHRLTVDVAPTSSSPGLSGELMLHADQASAPLSVSSRLPGGAMYTHKVLFPVSGELRAGERRYRFEPDRDLAILDEHKSFLPYRTRWLWGTFGMREAAGRPIGANFVDRPELPGQPEESCLWTPGRSEELAEVTFTPGRAAWAVSSRDGRLDVTFEIAGQTRVRKELVLAGINYVQYYGRYRGTMTSLEGTTYDVDVNGVLESMRMRS